MIPSGMKFDKDRKRKDHGTRISNKEMRKIFIGVLLLILFLTVFFG